MPGATNCGEKHICEKFRLLLISREAGEILEVIGRKIEMTTVDQFFQAVYSLLWMVQMHTINALDTFFTW